MQLNENMDPVAWKALPVLVEFHMQWWRARGKSPGAAKLAFSRDWETLLADAGLTSAELRADAERDARMLQQAGLWKILPLPRRPHLPGRLKLPVDQELRLAALFGDPVVGDAQKFDASQIDWVPELAFLTGEKFMPAPEDLLAINDFLREGGRERPLVPVKERSVQLFGDEKRLDALVATNLFREGRLSLELLRAFFVAEPLGWRRGPAQTGAVLVLENAATWDSFSRWNRQSAQYAAVIYGAGHRFLDGVPYLREIENEVGSIGRIDYFGDIDPEGLRIPFMAGPRCLARNLPKPVPLTWAYRLLLDIGKEAPLDIQRDAGDCTPWLGEELADPVRKLFQSRCRLAQEWIGHEQLNSD